MNIHIISITGDIASGKGTITNLLQKELGYNVYKNGEYVRKLATEMGMSIVEFQEYLNQHEEIDRQVEKSASEYAAEHDNLIIDARLGFYAVPHSFKVYLKVDLKESARRAYNDSVREVNVGESVIINKEDRYSIKAVDELHIIEVQIGDELGISERSVRRLLAMKEPPQERIHRERKISLVEHEETIQKIINEYGENTSKIYVKLTEYGVKTSLRSVQRWMQENREKKPRRVFNLLEFAPGAPDELIICTPAAFP